QSKPLDVARIKPPGRERTRIDTWTLNRFSGWIGFAAAREFDVGISHNDVGDWFAGPTFRGQRGPINTSGAQSVYGHPAYRIARLGPERHWRSDIVHRVVREQHVIEQPFGPVPCARLKNEPRKHIRAALFTGSAMRSLARTVEEAIVDNEMRRGADQ